MGVGWRFSPLKLITFGVATEVGRKLALSVPPLLRPLKTSLFLGNPRGWWGWLAIRPAQIDHIRRRK